MSEIQALASIPHTLLCGNYSNTGSTPRFKIKVDLLPCLVPLVDYNAVT